MKRVITLSLAFLVPFIFSLFISSSLTLPSGVNAASETQDVSVTLEHVLSITVNPSNLEFNITPNPSGTFMKKSGTVTVNTNNPTGYNLTFSDQDENTNLLTTNSGGSNNSTTPISSISTNSQDLDTIDTNKWGYAANTDTTFKPIPLSSTPAAVANTTSPSQESYPFTIGTKIDTTIPAGTYTDKVIFTATANYVPPVAKTFWTMEDMQDMTSEICADVATPSASATTSVTSESAYTDPNTQVPERTLTDTRDGNTYVIRKLADGKCWMTQNLRLGTEALPSAATVSSDITLTSADSNVSSSFTIPTSAIQTSGNTDWYGTYDAVHVYNNGNSWIAPTSAGSNSTVNTTGTPPNQSEYMGNYYNWYTATAGTGTYTMTSGEATSSICPKGWKLPTSGSTTADYSTLTGTLVNITTSASNAAASFTMQSAPNYFVLSGYYRSGVSLQGSYGGWWSSAARSSAYAYFLALDTSGVYPQDNRGGYYGFSVRCVAQ